MPKVRAFIAFDLSSGSQSNVNRLLETLQNDPHGGQVKWMVPDLMHITLHFLGQIPSRDVVPLCRLLDNVGKKIPPFRVMLKGLGGFPNNRRPKILWAGMTEGAEPLEKLHDALATRLEEMGEYRRESRGYTPHLTLGRLNKEADQDYWSTIIQKYEKWDGGYSHVSEILLYQSELRHDGPQYSIIGRADLRG